MKKISPHKKIIKKKKPRGILVRITLRLALLGVIGAISFTSYRVIQAYIAAPTCANSLTCTSDLTEKVENHAIGVFEGKKFVPPPVSLPQDFIPVLGANIATTSGEKHIYVDLSTQTLYAYQGSTQVFKTLISSGKWHPTPVGNFHIWEKLRSTRMAGGEGADAYDLPNVPYVMYFYHDFGLHGAYWHDNFGHAMSHGCVNMRQVDAKVMYDWTDAPTKDQLGTAVSICNSITNNQCIQDNPLQG